MTTVQQAPDEQQQDDPLRAAQLAALDGTIREQAEWDSPDGSYARLQSVYPGEPDSAVGAELFTREQVDELVSELHRAGRVQIKASRTQLGGGEIRLYLVGVT